MQKENNENLTKKLKVQILVYDGFDELDAIAPYEVLRNAIKAKANLQVEFVRIEGPGEVTAQHGLRFQATASLDEEVKVLVVPGGGWVARSPQGAWAEAKRGVIPASIARCMEKGATIASVCTGAMLVAAAGLMQGRHATTHHNAFEELAASGAKLVRARVVDDGNLISAGGVTSGLDLGLWLVERYFGAEVAVQVEDGLEYERRGAVWRLMAQSVS